MRGLPLFAFSLVVAIAVSGCVSQQDVPATSVQVTTTTQPPATTPFVQPGVNLCGDGNCDNYEKQSGDCPQDCGGEVKQPSQQNQQPVQQRDAVSVKATGSIYKPIQSRPSGKFSTGQGADILLSGVDFNNAGGPLLFNHPGGVASDGTRLVMADRFNNRVLIWNELPAGNTPPDIVLGQTGFNSNNPGTSVDRLNWPVSVSTAGGKLVVTDTYNDRILIWNTFPTKNGQAADLELKDVKDNQKQNIGWPWAVWTDGKKLVVTSTSGARVLIWNTFPTRNNQAADIVLYAKGNFGTPRSIATDGKHLMIGDHNAKVSDGPGNFFWKTFPTKDDDPYDFFVADVSRMAESQQNAMGDVLWSSMTADGKLIGVSNQLHIWDSFPENGNDAPRSVGSPNRDSGVGYDFGGSQSGDGSGIAMAGEKLYISLYNGNKIVGFNSMPTREDQKPDFAIGAPDIGTNTLKTNYFSTNAVPLTDGKSLFVLSSFDSTLYVWKSLPDESGAKPDFVYTFANSLGSFAVVRDKLIIVAGEKLFVWSALPLNGEKPDITFDKNVGGVDIAKINGIAGDDKYFYVSTNEGKTHVWDGVPVTDASPKLTINAELPGLYSDGTHITSVETFGHRVKIYRVADLISNPQNPPKPMIAGGPGVFNLPQGALVRNNMLFVADTIWSRVLVWNNFADAVAGKGADVILGEKDLAEKTPEIGRDKLFWPSGIDFDGSYLWVGSFKFSNRLLRFSVR